MLQPILESVRVLLDEAYAADQLRHATTLSKLTSTIEAAVFHTDEIAAQYVERGQLVAMIEGMVGRILEAAKARLTEDEVEIVATVLGSLVPPALVVDPAVESMRKELGYIQAALDRAIADKAIPEVNRLAQSAVTKVKLLIRTRIKAGELIDEQAALAATANVLDTANSAKAAIRKPDVWYSIVDDFLKAV